MDENTIRKILQNDPEIARSIPPSAIIEHLHKIEITEALRLAIEYPRLFKHYKGQTMYAARITCKDPETNHWIHHAVFASKNGKILLVT